MHTCQDSFNKILQCPPASWKNGCHGSEQEKLLPPIGGLCPSQTPNIIFQLTGQLEGPKQTSFHHYLFKAACSPQEEAATLSAGLVNSGEVFVVTIISWIFHNDMKEFITNTFPVMSLFLKTQTWLHQSLDIVLPAHILPPSTLGRKRETPALRETEEALCIFRGQFKHQDKSYSW